MFSSDILFILQWWIIFFLIGIVFLPLTALIFSNFFDKGYIFAKILGIAIVSYLVFLFGVLKILPFTFPTILVVLFVSLIANLFLIFKSANWRTNIQISLKKSWKIFIFEELLFATGLVFWSFIRGHQPDIHGLEKFMDFGFVNSILRADYFPPKDMWFTPFSINYYYFGHLVTAVLTKLSGIPSFITYNLMLSTIFALTFTASFSIGANLMSMFTSEEPIRSPRRWRHSQTWLGRLTSRLTTPARWIVCGFLTALLVSFAGNLQTIYAFFTSYQNANPVPFWQLLFSPNSFPNSYWYPNATRFIYNTIHEFPIYSFVVSDLHGHVLDIPFVLLTIAVLLSLFFKSKLEIINWKREILLISFLLAVMYMTNAWDGIIYFLLSLLILLFIRLKSQLNILTTIYYILFLGFGFFLFFLPFSIFFKPFVSGIGIICTPEFLINIGKLGPFLFETNHCQRSPLWQLFILYGFFYFWVFVFTLSFIKHKFKNLQTSDIFIFALIILSTILIIIPEFIYVKDIYPAHYRANTMFKLVYQSFILLSISSGYIIIRLISNIKYQKINIYKILFFIFAILFFILVMVYPFLAINSYYGGLQTYHGLDGTVYLKKLYPTDYEAILWINKNIKNQPVILEAQGDSYTDFARISSNTGLPTVLGWAVHEWLWRGTYDMPAPRINDVKTLYETDNINIVKSLLNKYRISYVFVGDLERQKYTKLNENNFKKLGNLIYQNDQTKIYKINSEEF